MIALLANLSKQLLTVKLLHLEYFCVHPTGLFLLFPASAIQTLGFRSFEGKVFILSLPNLVWVFFGVNSLHGIAFGEDRPIAN